MKPDPALEAKILAAIDGRILSPKRIASQLGYGTSQIQLINNTMLSLQKRKLARYQDGGWTKTDVEPSAAPPVRKPAKIEKEPPAPVNPQPSAATSNGHAERSEADAPTASSPAPVAEETVRRPHRVTTDMKRKAAEQKAKIVELLKEHEALTAPHVLELLADPSLAMKDVQNRLTAMRLAGEIYPTGHGYALVSNAAADAIDVKLAATAVQAAHTVQISTCQIDNPTPEVIGALKEMAQHASDAMLDLDKLSVRANEEDQARETAAQLTPLRIGATSEAPKIDIGVAPMCDIRAKLMEMADLVRDGAIDREKVDLMLRILNHAAAIDQAAAEVTA